LGDAKEEGRRGKYELVRLPYRFKFEKQFRKPCFEWLEMIETMCNEILRNYTKKEGQLMTAAFGTRPKRRLNRVMDALNFEYPDYDRLDEGAEGAKRKRVVIILSRQAVRSIKEDQESLKKMKTVSKLKALTPNQQKLAVESSEKTNTPDVLKPIACPSSSAVEVSEILKVMTESFPFTPLSPLGLKLTSLLQKKEVSSTAEGRDGGQKK
jgi:hypothetical protein